MRIETSLLPDPRRITGEVDVAVVIDVLRATSVMTTAFQAGAESVVTCCEIETATSLADQMQPRPLLCGERDCKRIEGFDLGNSPAEYAEDRVGDRSLVMTTTNGTVAIEAGRRAQKMVVASFLNLSAVIDSVVHAEVIHLICAGTNGSVTGEDTLLAGAIVAGCETRRPVWQLNDESAIARGFWRNVTRSEPLPSASDLTRALRETQGGRNLVNVGYEADLGRCALIDTATEVPHRVSMEPATFRCD